MNPYLFRILTFMLAAFLLPGVPLTGQDLPKPTFRPADAPQRALRTLDTVQTVDRDISAARRAFADTGSGTLAWLEFEPGTLAQSQSSDSPESAALGFLAAYGTRLFGTELTPANLELVRRYRDEPLTHFRYAQRYNGRRVYGGDLLVHVARVGSRYAVQSVNGRIYPGIDVPAEPSVTFDAARQAALGTARGGRTGEVQDSTPVILPHDDGYRLAYLVNISDPTKGLVTRFVDAASGAPFAETPAVVNFRAKSAGGPVPRAKPGASARPMSGAGAMDYVSTEGFDALNARRFFNVWRYSPTRFAMGSNGWPGVTEISIRDFAGQDIGIDHCSSAYPVVESVALPWPSDEEGKEEASAVANMGETLRFYNTKFGRQGIRDEYDFWGRPVLHTARACVHGTFEGFNAVFYPTNETWGFVAATETAKTSAAAQDVVTHEMQHGVTHYEVNMVDGYPTNAINEALSDYFGTRHRGSSCLGFDALGFCLREINSTLTLDDRLADVNCGYHCIGVAFSSALWPQKSNDLDWAVYNGLRFYMPSTTGFITGREAIVRAAKDRLANGQASNDFTYSLENEFFQRRIGFEAVLVSVVRPPACTEWYPRATAGTRTFALRFEAGTSYRNDGSAASPFYTKELGSFTPTSLESRVPFMSSELAGHTLNDGHAHAFRFRFTDVSPSVGFLHYFARGDVGCGIMPVADQETDATNMPTQFAVRQAVGTTTGLVSSRAMSARPAGDTGQRSDPSRAGLAEQVRAFGVTALEVDVPANMAGKRIEMNIFDAQGRLVRRISKDDVSAGINTVRWDAKTERGGAAPAGVYVVVVRYGDVTRRTRFVIPRSE